VTDLAAHDVHVWWSPLPASANELPTLQATLSADEQERAARFVFDRHRAEYVTARGLLRRLLGEYLGVPPHEVRFVYGSHGKPGLASPFHATDLRFNVSHTQGLAVMALARGRDLGVDVERERADIDLLGVAHQVFPESHVAALRRLPLEQRQPLFFTLWTLLEASVKATGAGLASDTRAITLADDLALASVPSFAALPAATCALERLDIAPSYAAALAVATTNASSSSVVLRIARALPL
jgi:4'-phosphopantetheinyl transferase